MRIAVTGGYGFLGSHVSQELVRRKHEVIRARSHRYDLRNFHEVDEFLTDNERYVAGVPGKNPIDVLVHVAAFVGGIKLNVEEPGRMMYDNLRMGLNVIEQCRRHEVEHVVLIGTACSYPADAPVPIFEDSLFMGRPTPETGPYGVAKLTMFEVGKAYCEQYGMKVDLLVPSNLYGPNDNYDPVTSHVIPALIDRFVHGVPGDRVRIMGDGEQTRDFLFVEDAARGVVEAAERETHGDVINLGSGRETKVAEVALILEQLTGSPFVFTGEGPVGSRRRVLDITRARLDLDWQPRVTLKKGLELTVADYRGRKDAATRGYWR
jgi:nucleoside-diphosphate-sugar epimerase